MCFALFRLGARMDKNGNTGRKTSLNWFSAFPKNNHCILQPMISLNPLNGSYDTKRLDSWGHCGVHYSNFDFPQINRDLGKGHLQYKDLAGLKSIHH